MIWFALQNDSTLFNLGDCGDFDAADQVAMDQGLEVVWIFDQTTAQNWYATLAQHLSGAERSLSFGHALLELGDPATTDTHGNFEAARVGLHPASADEGQGVHLPVSVDLGSDRNGGNLDAVCVVGEIDECIKAPLEDLCQSLAIVSRHENAPVGSASVNAEQPASVPKKYYIAMTWENWPQCSAYTTVVTALNYEEASKLCMREMLAIIIDEGLIDKPAEDADLDVLADHQPWYLVDMFALDEFFHIHMKEPT